MQTNVRSDPMTPTARFRPQQSMLTSEGQKPNPAVLLYRTDGSFILRSYSPKEGLAKSSLRYPLHFQDLGTMESG